MNYLTLNSSRVINYFEKIQSDNLGFYFSFFLHFLILISAVGFPNLFGPKEISIPTIIPIEIINVDEFTSIPKEKIDNKSTELKNIKLKVKEKKFNSSDNQEIRKIEIKKKPLIKDNMLEEKILSKEIDNLVIKEKKEVKIDLKDQEINIATNKFESLPSKKIKPKLKPQSKRIVEEKIQKSDVVLKSSPKPKPEPEFDIASMLKDLRNDKTVKKVEGEIEEDKNEKITNLEEDKNDQSAQLSISEIDLVLQQLSKCFIAPAGAEIKKTMFVKISARIQPNKKVYENSIRIVDTNISKSSSVYGPITESAMRTLLNPECIPLKLPEDKYDLWKNLTMKFDYSIMRGS